MKPFFEVFPDFEPSQELKSYFDYVYVERIIMHRKSNTLMIYINSTRLISRVNTWRMERSIRETFFHKAYIKVRFHETYSLSSQYNLEKLTREYWDSFLFEWKGKSLLIYNLMKHAVWNVEDDVLTLTLEDSFLSKSKADDIRIFYESMYKERFGMDIHIGFDYQDANSEAFRKERDHKLAVEAGSIFNRIKDNQEQKEEIQQQKRTKHSGSSYQSRRVRQSDPDLIYGRNCDGEIMPISEITEEIGEVVIHGQILNLDMREIRNEKTILMFAITDFTDTIKCKIFVKNIDLPDILDLLVNGNFYRVKGMALYDKFDHEVSITSVTGIKSIPSFVTEREDTSLDKRVELHMHTVMSDMDSVVDIAAIIKRAKKWGHPAIAITDHGVLQAFPIANHVLPKDDPFKIIYGCEGYFVDDLMELVRNEKGQTLDDSYVVFDIETTGFSAANDKIIEIGAVKIVNGKEVDRFSEFINPEIPIPFKIEQLTSINDEMVKDAPLIDVILPKFLEFCDGSILVAHNAEFDTGFIKAKSAELQLDYDFTVVDTMTLARVLLTGLAKFTLDNICKHLNISLEHHHRAIDDASATATMFLKLAGMCKDKGVYTLHDINEMGAVSADIIKKSRAYHGIILVKNETGRINLNRLVSASHIDYFNRRPRMPMSLIQKYREGLILGSACEAGELYQAILSQKPEEEIARLVHFFDYLEIQPIGNNMFMIESDRIENVNSIEDIENINRKIVALGEQYHKPVVATCDVHFLDPKDEQYRRILMAGKGFKDADNQAPLYFRTTEEMLKEFAYLGSEKAKEVVVTNPNLINSWIERVSPVHPDKCPPVIPDSDKQLRKICYDKAHEIYGPEIPEIVTARLERELNSIISNGFAVMYIIAQRLVWDSVEHGYLVGSRGSVGSSLAATMAGITEVNPLPAHYICPNCYYADFDSDKVKPYVQMGKSGCDMPDARCPKCGKLLNKEGHDIPFETFLGFKGNKEPDIDLNFSGDYQAKAHAYVEVIFGKGTAYRAGTIGTLAEKTAYGYVYKYFEERDIHKRRCELERIAAGCTGVKRTTGQHPGGIIVVPHGREIYEFTAIQHPANDQNTPIVTTHFEYHSIDHNLLKLDILGHDDPTMIRYLEDLTGIKATTIALDDQKVMSLFHSTEALGIKPEDIGGIELGSLGVPEFGTDFVMQMLKDIKPKSFSDLVRIAGLSHGTDVWLGNAQELINRGTVSEIADCICTRDDIMIYLINMGLDSEESFNIMEKVRKGIVAKGKCPQWPEWKADMEAHNVPDWYIGSCEKIKYMFPKAHAAAYVMMGWRIAWYKVFEPLAYYAAFFSIRASAFSYELMCFGKEKLEEYLNALLKMPKEQTTKKEQDLIRDMRIVQEMYARGYEFLPLDIYRAKDKYFQIIDGKIMPSFASIDGMGEKAAEQAMLAAKDGAYTSIENFRNRTKVSQTITEKMKEMGLFHDLPDSDQLTFDFI
ncbi:MAG: PolC-type DNA polymerase III [Lachnospiraceae bacterium]|nr:PolC-type DNA polymerase III [Lachnospiraceae bacterium]